MAEVEVGMTRRQVKRLLGRPSKTINEKQFLGSYSSVIRLGGWRRSRSEAWVYLNLPQAGQATWIMLERGRVVEVRRG
ncbi:outer membrane protein assembly factor BamE domain-containing protein [Streptomyces sp. NBC_00286]|uniref:outer membrane protein assembly factor BamE domain-containing protein n=1 Tax=Streptomyces sp. NBC_00286 TaxID=2975701 RepID=UPI003FA79CCA